MAGIIAAPIRLAIGMPTAVSQTITNIFKGDVEKGERPPVDPLMKLEDRNLFELASPNLDLCSIIYYYTELRSATKNRLKTFAESKNLSYKFNSRTPCDVELLYNALSKMKECRDNIEIALSPSTSVAEYKASLKGLDDLKIRFKLTDGDMQVLEQYFLILSTKPKSNTDIKRDLRLYSSYISPQFRLFFGEDFNIESIESLVNIDETSYIHKIDDDFITTSLDPGSIIKNIGAELVYAIAISDKFKTISVVFRGSINIQDWLQNFDVNSTECKFPGFTTARGMETIEQTSFGKVHAGFYDYLFSETKAGRNGSTMSKSEEIMGILASLLDGEKKGYRICFTGHSLGGALSTLMATRCAAFNQLKTTVLNVSIASPFVGDQTFRDSFYKMEQEKHIMHLRISNYEDIVPLIPASTFPLPDFHTYKHTGWNVKLFNKSLTHPYFSKSYPKKGDFVNEVFNAFNTNIFVGFNLNISNHTPLEYHSRLEAAKDELKQYTLSDLYNDSDWTGWKYDKEAEPEITGVE